jgi:hypothetical protein
MTVEQVEKKVIELIYRKPFVAFLVEFKDGQLLKVPHPRLAINGGGAGFIGPDGAIVDFEFNSVHSIRILDTGAEVMTEILPEAASIEIALLLALWASRNAGSEWTKCDVVLRGAMQTLRKYDREKSEDALCNAGDEDPDTKRFYDVLRQLIRHGFAEGKGNLRLPAGPRYTECRLSSNGVDWLGSLPRALHR